MNSDEYAYLHKCGADYVTVFQETYHADKYETLHLAGHKRIYPYRVNAQERALYGRYAGRGFRRPFWDWTIFVKTPLPQVCMPGIYRKNIPRQRFPSPVPGSVLLLTTIRSILWTFTRPSFSRWFALTACLCLLQESPFYTRVRQGKG